MSRAKMTENLIKVVGAVIVRDDLILCAKRGKGNHETLGKWEFPGGKVEDGESEVEALVREIKEELDFDIIVGEKIVTSTHTYEFGTVQMTSFYCTPKGDVAQPKKTEHSQLMWLKPTDLLELDFAPVDVEAVDIVSRELG